MVKTALVWWFHRRAVLAELKRVVSPYSVRRAAKDVVEPVVDLDRAEKVFDRLNPRGCVGLVDVHTDDDGRIGLAPHGLGECRRILDVDPAGRLRRSA